MQKLKLFVWKNVLCDYTCGVMFALAPDVETARQMLREHAIEDELKAEPSMYTEPIAVAVWGGG